MSDMVETDKSFKKGKLICKIDDVRGDSFTRLDPEEKESNVELILSSRNLNFQQDVLLLKI
jgi:hypothetical protein